MDQDKLDFHYLSLAMKEAKKAEKKDEVPVGALLCNSSGEILARAHNLKESSKNPMGHAECLCIHKACKKIKNWRLEGCTLYTTLEPCVMCLSVCQQARIHRVVFGAYDQKGGALSLNYLFHKQKKLHHLFQVEHYSYPEASLILTRFFQRKRLEKRQSLK